MQHVNKIPLSMADVGLLEEELICSITQECFTKPVLTSSGTTYERDAISKWLEDSNTDPSTRSQITRQLIPNRFVEAILLTKDQNRLNVKDFYCPLTKQLIREPVTTSEGYTYEKDALEAYFLEEGDIEPTTGKPIKDIGEAKYVNNLCAKNLIARYTQFEAKFKEKIDLLFAYYQQGNLDAILNSDTVTLNAFLLTQNRENQLKCFDFGINSLNVQAVTFFSQFFILEGKLDEDVVFFRSVERIQALAAKYFPQSLNPLSQGDFNWKNLPQKIQTIRDNLAIQEKFREVLMKNPEAIGQYTVEQILFSIDSVDENGETLLHWAVKCNNLLLVSHLLDNGIDFTKENNQGKTAVSMALDDVSHQPIVDFLCGRGVISVKREAVLHLPSTLMFLQELDFLRPVLKLIFGKESTSFLPIANLEPEQANIVNTKSQLLHQALLDRCVPLFSPSHPTETEGSLSENCAKKSAP